MNSAEDTIVNLTWALVSDRARTAWHGDQLVAVLYHVSQPDSDAESPAGFYLALTAEPNYHPMVDEDLDGNPIGAVDDFQSAMEMASDYIVLVLSGRQFRSMAGHETSRLGIRFNTSGAAVKLTEWRPGASDADGPTVFIAQPGAGLAGVLFRGDEQGSADGGKQGFLLSVDGMPGRVFRVDELIDNQASGSTLDQADALVVASQALVEWSQGEEGSDRPE